MNIKEQFRQAFGSAAESNMTPERYYEFIKDLNTYLQAQISKTLREFSDEVGIITLVTPGSDGRLEKGNYLSKYELIALVEGYDDSSDYRSALVESLRQIFPGDWSDYVELKGKNANLALSHGRYQPGRIADGALVYGKYEDLRDAKLTLGQQVYDFSKNEIGKIEDLRREARRTTESGSNTFHGESVIHFDQVNGKLYFNPESFQLSFKIGPLRLVQNTLLLEESRYVRRTGRTDFFNILESNIQLRLQQFADDKITSLNPSDLNEIFRHYAFFLKLYHQSERAYSFNGKLSLDLSHSEVDEIVMRQKRLLELVNRFKLN